MTEQNEPKIEGTETEPRTKEEIIAELKKLMDTLYHEVHYQEMKYPTSPRNAVDRAKKVIEELENLK